MKRLAGNKDGYVVGWMMTVMLALSILLLAVLSISAGYHGKVLKRRDSIQAYYTARTVLELAAASVTSDEEDELAAAIRTALDEGETSFEISVDGLDTSMGSCVLRIIYEEEEGRLMIKAVSDCRGSKEEMMAVLRSTPGDAENSWRLEGYRDGGGSQVEKGERIP